MPSFLTEFQTPIFVALTLVAWYLIMVAIVRGGDRGRVRRFQRVAKQLGLDFQQKKGCELRGELDGMRVKVSWNRREVRDNSYGEGGTDFNSGTKFKVYFAAPIDVNANELQALISTVRKRHRGLRVGTDGVATHRGRRGGSVGGMIQTLRQLVKTAREIEDQTAVGAASLQNSI